MDKKRKPIRFTREDLAYVSFSLDEHLALLKGSHSCMWEPTLASQTLRTQRVKRKFANLVLCREVNLTEDDVLFIEFAMKERCDYLAEGMGTGWHSDAKHDAIKAAKLIARLRRLLGIPEPELEPELDY